MISRLINLADIGKFVFQCRPEGRHYAVLILQAQIDESSDGKGEKVFAVGGILAHEKNLEAMQGQWIERLKTPDDLPYFRATDCKGVHGAFLKLRRKYGADAQAVADKVRADLEAILLSHHWIGFGIGVLVADYKNVWNTHPLARTLYRKDPVETAYVGMFFEIVRAVQKNAPEAQVAYVIDDSTYSGKIADAFKGFKLNHPMLAPSIATLAPLDDKITPPLQMADLIASIVKDVFLEWLNNGKPEHAPLELKWHDHFEIIGKWDKEHMLASMAETVNDPRYSTKTLAERPVPEPTKLELRRKEKQRRRALIKMKVSQ